MALSAEADSFFSGPVLLNFLSEQEAIRVVDGGTVGAGGAAVARAEAA